MGNLPTSVVLDVDRAYRRLMVGAMTAGGPWRAAAAELYGDLRLPALLAKLLRHSNDLLAAAASSVSLVGPGGDRYGKIAESGVACHLGHSFPLEEGVTGQVVRRRRPVVLASYQDVPVGHLEPGRAAAAGAVVAVPIWWRGDVIGANVVFAGRSRRFAAAEVDELEALTQIAAAGIVRAGAADPSLFDAIRDHSRTGAASGVHTLVTEVGAVRPVPPAVAAAAVDLVARAQDVVAVRPGEARLHVAVVHRADGLRLLVQDEDADAPEGADPLGTGARTWHELVGSAGGGLSAERVPGWGTLIRADFPHGTAGASADVATPLTARERQVLTLVGRGLSDREVASALAISRKTVEKHVGAALRKTGTTSRTAAVVRALQLAWIDPHRG